MALKGTVLIDQERCKGCDLCALFCPQGVLLLDPERLNAKGYHPALLDESVQNCTGCGVCAVICPDACITVFRQPTPSRAPRAAAPIPEATHG